MINATIQGSNTFGETEQCYRRLWLVRHGATVWNNEHRYCGHSDIPLSAEGRTQARWLARSLRAQPIAAFYSSDLLRARQTAQVIVSQSRQNVQVESSSAWREIAFGIWEGLIYDQIAQQDAPDFFTDPMHASPPPGGESLPALAQRVQYALRVLSQKAADPLTPDGDIVLVSHGGPLRVLLCSVLGMPLAQQWQLRLDPGSLSAIDFLPTMHEATPIATLALLNGQRPVRIKSNQNTLPREAASAEVSNDIPNASIGSTVQYA